MKSIGKRLLCLLIAVMMVAGLVPATVMAANQNPLPTATITAEKIFTVDKAADLNTALTEATFVLTRLSHTNYPTGRQKALADIPMPAGATVVSNATEITVNSFTANGATQKKGTAAFGAISYDTAGVYTYTYHEKIPSTPVEGITYDTSTYYVNVFVENVVDAEGNLTLNDTGALKGTPHVEVTGITVWKDTNYITGGSGSDPKKVNSEDDGTVTISITNSFISDEKRVLQVTKYVGGSNGDAGQEFEFVFNTDYSDSTNPLSYQVYDGDDTAVTGTGKSGSIANGDSFFLKHGEYVRITGMTDGTKYTITEEDATDYTTTITGSSGSTSSILIGSITGSTVRTATEQTFSTSSIDAQTFKNIKGGTIPTGVVLDLLPYVLLTVIAVGSIMFLKTRKRTNG